MWVYVAVFAVVIIFLIVSYRALGRDTALSDEQIAEVTAVAANALTEARDSLQNGSGDPEAIRKTCSAWQLKLEPLRDVQSSEEVADLLIRGFSLIEWAARLKLQSEKSEDPTFARAAATLVDGAKERS